MRIASIALGVIADKIAAILVLGALVSYVGVESRSFQVMALVAGSSCTVLGAFVAGHHAKQRFLAHGVAVGFVGLGISLTRFLLTPQGSSAAHSLPWELTAWSSVVVAGLAGGLLARRGAAVPAG